MLQSRTVCYRAVQYVIERFSMLQSGSVCYRAVQCVTERTVCYRAVQYVTERFSMLQSGSVCYRAVQYVTERTVCYRAVHSIDLLCLFNNSSKTFQCVTCFLLRRFNRLISIITTKWPRPHMVTSPHGHAPNRHRSLTG